MTEPNIHPIPDRALAAQLSSIAFTMQAMLQQQIAMYFAVHGDALPAAGLYDHLLMRFEKPLLATTLRATGGNQIKAAEILGLNRNTLRKKLRALKIDAKALTVRAAV